jgi:hypothetical protein
LIQEQREEGTTPGHRSSNIANIANKSVVEYALAKLVVFARESDWSFAFSDVKRDRTPQHRKG